MNNAKNSCYTYFSITGIFDPDEITAQLGLNPSKQWRIGDLGIGGKPFGVASWEYGRCEDYDVQVENQMMQTIKDLVPKINILQEIKKKFDVDYILEVVPSIYTGETTPCLAPNRAVIEFCYHTETDIDMDLWVSDSKESDEEETAL
jgi:hypothetical protein